jgi:HEPN domain-containing protein
MPDLDSARSFLAAARRDAMALAHMFDPEAFSLEIFGFHAQQAAEKSLKAWLSLRDIEPPRSHNLRHLLVLLESSGVSIESLWEMVFLTTFAVQFRYEAFDALDEPFDRPYWMGKIEGLLSTVEQQFKVCL